MQVAQCPKSLATARRICGFSTHNCLRWTRLSSQDPFTPTCFIPTPRAELPTEADPRPQSGSPGVRQVGPIGAKQKPRKSQRRRPPPKPAQKQEQRPTQRRRRKSLPHQNQPRLLVARGHPRQKIPPLRQRKSGGEKLIHRAHPLPLHCVVRSNKQQPPQLLPPLPQKARRGSEAT